MIERIVSLEQRLNHLEGRLAGAERSAASATQQIWQTSGGGGGTTDGGFRLWIAHVETNITQATDHDTPGSGTAKRYTSFDGTNLGDLEADAITVWNYHDRQFDYDPDSTVLLASILNVYWVLDAWSCTALSP